MSWLGNYHFVFVHFPIALIILAGIAEVIQLAIKKDSLSQTVNFLLLSAFLFAIPTIATGLILEDAAGPEIAGSPFLEWHESFAFATLGLAFLTLVLLYWKGRGLFYYAGLALLVLSVVVTAYLGGEMAFGHLAFLPAFGA